MNSKTAQAIIIYSITLIAPLKIFYNFENSPLYFLSYYSPIPIVFSKGPRVTKVYKNFKFEIINTNNKVYEKSFNRNFYKNLPGTHRFKLMTFKALNKNSRIKDSRNLSYYHNYFCNNQFAAKGFEIEGSIKEVKIKQNDKIYLWVKCDQL